MSIFQNGGDCPSWTFKHCNLQLRRSICVSVQNFVLIGQIVGEILQFFDFFQNGGRPPAWICYVHVWTTNDEYLVLYITLQNLVGIDAVVSIICKCWYLTCLVWKCIGLFTPQMQIYGGFYLLNGEQSHRDPQKAPPMRSTPYDVLDALQRAIQSPKSAPFCRDICIPI